MFFNIGGGEILVIAMIALIAVGPEQLPTVLRKLGRGMSQVRSMTSSLRDEFMSGIDEVNEIANPKSWMGSGSDDDPVVPRGYADSAKNGTGTAEAADVDADTADIDTADDGDVATDASGEGDDGTDEAPTINQIALANAMRATPEPKPAAPVVDDDAAKTVSETAETVSETAEAVEDAE